MALLKCKMCGGSLEVTAGETIIECEYCGTQQTLPKTTDENIQALFNRANLLRQKNEFDKAEAVYEKILEADDTEAEAYWGVILCKFGIEYVEDPKTYKRIPTCHRTSYDSIVADEYYKKAIENADITQRTIYEAEAKKIDEIQKGILAISAQEEPYDVFICYKETDESGRRTQDSVIANDIYYQLTNEGFKVFYAAITLEEKLGTAYEPIIFAALNSSKVMLSIGTKPEYLNAVWVKNEWSRFLKMMKNDRSKMLIPCYKGMDAYELPEEFAHLQAQDMSKIGFINDLVRGIKKVIKKDEPKQSTVIKETVVSTAGTNLASILKRAFIFLEDEDWESADEYFEKVLDLDPENAEAYLGKLMAENEIKTLETLLQSCKDYRQDKNYSKARRYADKALLVQLVTYEEKCEENFVTYQINLAKACKEKGQYYSAISRLERLRGIVDIEKLLAEAVEEQKNRLLAVLSRVSRVKIDGKYGYINESGEIVIKPTFDDADDFSDNGLAKVKIDGKYGFINESGEIVIKPTFDDADDFSDNGLARVTIDGKYGFINESGEIVIKPTFSFSSFFSNGLARVTIGAKCGFINKSGEIVIEPAFDNAYYFFDNGLAAVKIGGKYGYINESGEIVIKPTFDDADAFSDNGLAKVKIGKKYGFINESGEIVIKPTFDDAAYYFSTNGLAKVKIGEKYGFINESGEIMIEPTFDDADAFSDNGLAKVKIDGKYGFINESGEIVIKPTFDDARDFSNNGLAAVKIGGKYGFINESGKIVIRPAFDNAYYFYDNGLAAVKIGGKYGFINESGEIVIKPAFDDAFKMIAIYKSNVQERKQRTAVFAEEKRIAEEKRVAEEIEKKKEALLLKYKKAMEEKEKATTSQEYYALEETFLEISENYYPAKEQAEECLEKGVELRTIEINDERYKDALERMKKDDIQGVEWAIEIFLDIIEWKDSREQLTKCQARLPELRAKAEREKLNKEKRKKQKKIAAIVITIASIIFIILTFTVFIPSTRYNNAIKSYETGNYKNAVVMFEKSNNFKDCEKSDIYYKSLYEYGQQLENTSILLAYETYSKLPDGYENVTQRIEMITPYLKWCNQYCNPVRSSDSNGYGISDKSADIVEIRIFKQNNEYRWAIYCVSDELSSYSPGNKISTNGIVTKEGLEPIVEKEYGKFVHNTTLTITYSLSNNGNNLIIKGVWENVKGNYMKHQNTYEKSSSK